MPIFRGGLAKGQRYSNELTVVDRDQAVPLVRRAKLARNRIVTLERDKLSGIIGTSASHSLVSVIQTGIFALFGNVVFTTVIVMLVAKS